MLNSPSEVVCCSKLGLLFKFRSQQNNLHLEARASIYKFWAFNAEAAARHRTGAARSKTETLARRLTEPPRRALCKTPLFLLPSALPASFPPHVLLKLQFSSKPATIVPTSDSICFTHELNLFSSILTKNLWIYQNFAFI